MLFHQTLLGNKIAVKGILGICCSAVQAFLVAGKGLLYSHRNIQPGQLSVLLQTALESPCGLNIFTGIWTAEVLGGASLCKSFIDSLQLMWTFERTEVDACAHPTAEHCADAGYADRGG